MHTSMRWSGSSHFPPFSQRVLGDLGGPTIISVILAPVSCVYSLYIDMLISQWSPKTWNHWECCGFPSKSFCFLQVEEKSEQNQDLSRWQPVVPTRIPVMRGNDIKQSRRNRRHKSLPRIAPTGTCFLSHSRSNSSIKLWWHGAFDLGQVGLLGIQTKRLLMQKKIWLPTYYPHLYA